MSDTVNPDKIKPGQDWVADLFQPRDAVGVVNLFQSVYGDGYPVPAFVDPAELIRANADRRIISSVARTAGGDIVGHNALFRSAPYERMYESGAGVVHPGYRGSGIGHELVFHGQEMARQQFGMDAIFGEPVCNHLFMQKLLLTIGWAKATAIEVDLMPAEAYSREKSAAGRVTALMDFVLFQKSPQSVYVPDECREMIQSIYQEFPDERYLHPAIDDIPSCNHSQIALSVFDFSHVARITIQTAGADLAGAIDRAEASVLCQGVTVIQVWANLSWPWIGQVVNLLHSRGYFVGGVLPRWFDQDGILLQKLCHTPQWDHIQLLTDHAKHLLEFVRADYNRFCR